jgi:tRNA(fMet)-specific endonuclease VapC
VLKYMLDTNIVIYALRNKPERVRRAFDKHATEMCLSTISLGELIYGAERSALVEQNLAVIEGLTARLEVASFDYGAAVHSGQIRAELSQTGQAIGPYDMLIAGHARSLGMILVTNNLKEFGRVPGLRLQNWA